MDKEWTRYEVENEPGSGQFFIDLIEDNASVRTPVKPFNIPNGKVNHYIQEQFAAGEPIVALRFSERGMCGFLVNPEVLTVEKMTRYYPDDDAIFGNRLIQQLITPDEFYEMRYISPYALPDVTGNPLSGYFSIRGRTNTNLPFQAKVYFQPSPK